jgi:ABC-type multidrug transport system fused ATPase/permease subunit
MFYEGIYQYIFLTAVVIYIAGMSGFIGMILLSLYGFIRYFLRFQAKSLEQELNTETEKRIKKTFEVFSIIKFIKANALESSYFNKLRNIRIV